MWLRQISNLERLSVKWHLSCTSLVIIKILQTFLLPHGHVFHILNMFQITWLLFKGILLQSCTNQRWLILQSHAKGKNRKKGNPRTDLLVLKSIFGFWVRLQIRNLVSQLNASNVYGNESICLLRFSESCELWSQKFQPTVTFFAAVNQISGSFRIPMVYEGCYQIPGTWSVQHGGFFAITISCWRFFTGIRRSLRWYWFAWHRGDLNCWQWRGPGKSLCHSTGIF